MKRGGLGGLVLGVAPGASLDGRAGIQVRCRRIAKALELMHIETQPRLLGEETSRIVYAVHSARVSSAGRAESRSSGHQLPWSLAARNTSRSERRIELLLDAVSDYAIYMLDPNGFITSWNAGAEKIKGYRSIEILGQHFSRFFTAEDRAIRLPEKILEIARTTGRHEAEGWRVRKDGSRLWCNAILQRIVDETGQLIGFAKITRDISERAAAQQALLEAERRFRILVEGVIDYAIYMLDPSGLGHELEYRRRAP